MKFKLRFRWGYLLEGGFYKRYTNGFTLGPILFYKLHALVYYTIMLTSEMVRDSVFDTATIHKHINEDLLDGWKKSVPFDFRMRADWTLYTTHNVEYDMYDYYVEAFAVPIGRKYL